MIFLSRWRQRLPFLVVFLVLSGCGAQNVNLVTGESQRGAYSWTQQVQLGGQADQQIVAQYGLTTNAGVADYVDELGNVVLSNAFDAIERAAASGEVQLDRAAFSEIRQTPFTFRVLDSPVVNAFALPGGYVYVTRGLMAHLDNEAQLAMVLGHEIGHVVAQHSSRQAFKAQLGQLGVVGAAIGGAVLGGGDLAQGILEYGSQGAQLLFLKYGRDAEREADEAGVAYSEFSGYDAAQAADFFRSLGRIQEAGGGALPSFLSTHPDPSEREQTIPQLASLYEGTMVNASEYLAEIEGMVLGENPREGFVENGVFYHPELAFRFTVPNGWQVSNTRQAVLIGEPNGRAILQLSLASQSSAAQAAQELRGQQGISVTGQENYSANGNPAVLLEGQAAQQTGSISFLASYIEYGGNVYEILGYTNQQGYQTYAPEFSRTMRSFQRLSDSQYLNRQPVRLDVVTVNRSAPFSSFLNGRADVPGLTPEGLAILNQVGLSETIPSGTQLKLPR
ncbi:M48 family metalloprotease [Rubricoccus marinus]|uniref:Peptidase M48 domain-containing protein n=1 Tax=Rubricoccus marinus TaxID=716817 RepID=A0A259U2M3_9BACT|nr:M48 family metalloprotease [Rubricoccus marinus]OZC04249.1 hypothetical protein BSZ36_15420 [Rubricoccus marinus]